MLIPRITKSDNSIVKQMYKDGYILRAVTPEYMYWDRNEQVIVDEDHAEKQAMYEKMAELKRDPVAYKELEQKAFEMLSPQQKKSDACNFHRDTKLRQMIMEMV